MRLCLLLLSLLLMADVSIPEPNPGIQYIQPFDNPQSRTMCAVNRSENGAVFEYKNCPRDVLKGIIYFCVHLVVPPTEKRREPHVYGCVSSDDVPIECLEHGTYYFSYKSINISKKEYTGALFCCLDDYCNEIEEPPLAVVRVVDTDKFTDVARDAFPMVFVLVVLVACFGPVLARAVERRQKNSRRRAERPPVIPPMKAKYVDVKEVIRNDKIMALFDNRKAVNDVIKAMHHQAKYRTDFSLREVAVQVFPEIWVFQQDDWKVKVCRRMEQTTKSSLAEQMIEHGPYEFPFDVAELGDMFDSTSQIIAKEGSLLDIPGDVWIIGNLEGGYADLFRWFRIAQWPPRSHFLFLGGLVSDSNPYSLETIALIFALKKSCPNHVHILRGASETEYLNLEGRFSIRIAKALSEVIHKACSQLPFAAVVANKLLCVHGGIPKMLPSRDAIRDIPRPVVDIEKYSIEADLVFSTFGRRNRTIPGARGHQVDPESASFVETMSRLGILYLIRARNPLPFGYQFIAANTICLWSAPGACGTKAGAVLNINSNNYITIIKMRQNEKAEEGKSERVEPAKNVDEKNVKPSTK